MEDKKLLLNEDYASIPQKETTLNYLNETNAFIRNMLSEASDYGWNARKFHDKLSDYSEEEGRRLKAYRISDGEADDGKGDKDIPIPYFLEKFDIDNSDIDELIKVDKKFEKFMYKNALMSYGDSGGMMPHSDANPPKGAVVITYVGDSGDEEMQWELDWVYDFAKKVDKKVTPKALAQYMLDDDRAFWRAQYKQSDVDSIESEKDLSKLEVLAYEPVDTVVAIYLYDKDIKKFFKKNKDPRVKEILDDLDVE